MNCEEAFRQCLHQVNRVFLQLRTDVEVELGICSITDAETILEALVKWQDEIKRKLALLMGNCCVLQDCVGCWSVNCFELSDIEDEFFCKLDQSENNINGEKASEDIDSLFLPSNDGKCSVNFFLFPENVSNLYLEIETCSDNAEMDEVFFDCNDLTQFLKGLFSSFIFFLTDFG